MLQSADEEVAGLEPHDGAGLGQAQRPRFCRTVAGAQAVEHRLMSRQLLWQFGSRRQRPGDLLRFGRQSRGKDGQPHGFDESDVLPLDRMNFGVRVEDSVRMLARGSVVA